MRQKRWPTGLGYIFPPPANSNREKHLNPKVMITHKKSIIIKQILTNYKHLALRRGRTVSRVCRDLAAIPVVMSATGSMAPQIFSISCYFVLWVAVSQTKCCCFSFFAFHISKFAIPYVPNLLLSTVSFVTYATNPFVYAAYIYILKKKMHCINCLSTVV